jgi:hypothetical protein
VVTQLQVVSPTNQILIIVADPPFRCHEDENSAILNENLQTWRSAAGGGWSHSVRPGDYLKFLAANGYPLSPVEEVITGQRSVDEVYAEVAAAA